MSASATSVVAAPAALVLRAGVQGGRQVWRREAGTPAYEPATARRQTAPPGCSPRWARSRRQARNSPLHRLLGPKVAVLARCRPAMRPVWPTAPTIIRWHPPGCTTPRRRRCSRPSARHARAPTAPAPAMPARQSKASSEGRGDQTSGRLSLLPRELRQSGPSAESVASARRRSTGTAQRLPAPGSRATWAKPPSRHRRGAGFRRWRLAGAGGIIK